MAGVIDKYSRFDDSAVIRSLQTEELKQSEIYQRSVSFYGQNDFSP
jgi:hypothetical protein